MRNGRVKWFDSRKGYGFIVQEDGSDIFVHYSSIECEGFKSLAKGEAVTYNVETKYGRQVATNVVKVA